MDSVASLLAPAAIFAATIALYVGLVFATGALFVGRPQRRAREPGLLREPGRSLALRRARVIHVRREPADTCLSCYTRLFVDKAPWSYDLTELGRFYRAYDELMRHWRSVLPTGFMLEVQYEDLVADAGSELQRLCDFLGVELHPDMLDSDKRTAGRGRIRTNSYQQVAEAIYSRSAGRWTRYRKHLEPYLDTLRPHAEGMGYSVDVTE